MAKMIEATVPHGFELNDGEIGKWRQTDEGPVWRPLGKVEIFLTENEKQVLRSFIEAGRACNGSSIVEELVADNMTWTMAPEVAEATGLGLQSVGAVMASLQRKGLISDSGAPRQGHSKRYNDWTATTYGVVVGWNL